MSKTNAQIKTAARQNLLGHYKPVIAALLITELITLILNIPFDSMAQQGIAFGVPSRIVLGFLGSLVISLIATLLQAGVSHIHLQIARGRDVRYKDMFIVCKNRPDRYLGYGLLTVLLALVCILPGYLCMIPSLTGSYTMAAVALTLLGCALMLIGCIVMIIVFLSWSMTVFILLEDSDIRMMDAIRQSRQMMRGKKGRFLGLGLSFIGWILFSLLSFGIGLLWIIPYLSQSQTCFYLELLPEAAGQTANDGSANPYY
ncbi:MAG: DUF975 family protein [Clostridiales bacterium]|nr:DUF975 family protein [Clostridiales bacterium]